MTATLTKKLYRESTYSFPTVINKRNLTNSPTIGFEWEVPYDREVMDGDYGDVPDGVRDELNEFCNLNGFLHHFECGGTEFASPVAMTISQARMVAKVLQNYVSKARWTDDPESEDHCCGIHVTISPGKNHRKVIDCMARFIHSLNHHFVVELSGRDGTGCGDYHEQSYPMGFHESNYWDDGYDYPMFRPKGSRKLEVRMFGPRSETLIPAIEFVHSVCKFIQWHKVSKLSYLTIEDMPTGAEYHDWLMNKPGYSALKAYAPWGLIDDIVHP